MAIMVRNTLTTKNSGQKNFGQLNLGHFIFGQYFSNQVCFCEIIVFKANKRHRNKVYNLRNTLRLPIGGGGKLQKN